MFSVPTKRLPARPPNWGTLHGQLRTLYKAAGLTRKVAVLDNHVDRKEAICRRLGVICPADLTRLESDLRKRSLLPLA